MEAGLFVPSGTMSNAVAVRTHTQPGDEIIAEESSHLYLYEGGGYAARQVVPLPWFPEPLGFWNPRRLKSAFANQRGAEAIIPMPVWSAWRTLPTGEGEPVIPLRSSKKFAGFPRKRIVACIWTEPVCSMRSAPRKNPPPAWSKGSIRSRSAYPRGWELRSEAFWWDRSPSSNGPTAGASSLEEASRQSGILAAAGLYALDHNLARLREDHRRARRLAQGLAEIPGLSVDHEAVQTNMVYLRTEAPAKQWVDRLAEPGVACFALGDRLIRLVTHLQIDDEQIEESLMVFRKISSTFGE